MSQFETPWGALRRVQRDGAWVWKLQCPQCEHWGDIDDDQLHGRVSLDHTNCGITYEPSECNCTWHETHDYTSFPLVAAALRVQARVVEDASLLNRIASGPDPASRGQQETQ